MAGSIVARQQGDDFQGRMFWLKAALLLEETSEIKRVLFETGPKAFDDVVVDYEPSRAPQDHFGRPFLRDHMQCKWHVRPGDFGHEHLIDPSFTNSETVSILTRAREAQLAHAPKGEGARFQLVTNWNAKDPLRKLILNQTNAFDLDALFKGGPRSATGQIRELWSSHLGIDEEELRRLVRTLCLNLRIRSAEELREQLNDRFARVGMKLVPTSEAAFVYDDLIRKLHAQGRKDFDRNSFRDLVRDEKLLADTKGPKMTSIGVRSFMHPIDSLESRTSDNLNLVPFFEGRYLSDENSWNATIYPKLKEFVLRYARENDSLQLVLDAHVSLAFAIGAILDVKSGKTIEVEQRTNGRRFWSRGDAERDKTWPKLSIEIEHLGTGTEHAISVGLTHDIAANVRSYVAESLPQVGTLLIARLDSTASQSSVRCGEHAIEMAEALKSEATQQGRSPRTHLFISAPNAFAFFLGQLHQSLGAVTVYEWDFEGRRSGTYSKGIEIN